MTYGAIGAPDTATLAEAIETMLRSRASALSVFDAGHALIGVLSEGELRVGRSSASTRNVRAGSSSCRAAAGSPRPTPKRTGAGRRDHDRERDRRRGVEHSR